MPAHEKAEGETRAQTGNNSLRRTDRRPPRGAKELADLKERVAYLQGLATGFGDGADRRDQVLKEVLDVLGLVADRIAGLEKSHRELEAYVESLDEDLAEMEDDFYVAEEELEGVVCPLCGAEVEVEDEDREAGDLNCPECGHTFERRGRDAVGTRREEGEKTP